MFSWGAVTMGLGGAHNFAQVAGVRFLLGVLEAGLFPGLVFYLTFWYKVSERSLRVAFILASATLAGAFGGAIAYGVGHMNGAKGLSAWRWLFIIEGAPSCTSAIFVWLFLPDYPETCSFLNSEDKALAKQRLSVEGGQGAAKAMTWNEAKAVLTEWRLYSHYLVCTKCLGGNASIHVLTDIVRYTFPFPCHFLVCHSSHQPSPPAWVMKIYRLN